MSDFDTAPLKEIVLRRRALRREMKAQTGLLPVRIAVLGGSTTQEVVDFLELALLASGFEPAFYQSDFGRFYEDAVHGNEALTAFQPQIVYLHTSSRNLQATLPITASEDDLTAAVNAEVDRFKQIWSALRKRFPCQIVQNNFDAVWLATLGSLDCSLPGGAVRLVNALNEAFAREIAATPGLLLHDLASLRAQVGTAQWLDPDRWFSYKIAFTPEANLAVARSLAAMVRAIYGRSRKVLVLDLDNTLWGGTIGDDGVDGIVLGKETPLAEAFTAFQQYCLALRHRGVLLAVCSKNDDAVARSGFSHPDSVLRLEHFAAFRANWEPKHTNLLSIATELNLGLDSFVFVDDNPAERAIVAAQLPEVAVPDVGDNPALFPWMLQQHRYFEAVSLSPEDAARGDHYTGNAQRTAAQAAFANYGEYLDSLQMTAEIARIAPPYLQRIAQLTNKTNQFNLTTRRYTLAEIEAASQDPCTIGLYGRLSDRFGDNGLVSVVLGRREGNALRIDLWLMSCRVLKREMELAMLDALVQHARHAGVKRLLGEYLPTPRNGMVANHYCDLGFTAVSNSDRNGATHWGLAIDAYAPRSRHIRILSRL